MTSFADAFQLLVATVCERLGDAAVRSGRVLRDARGQLTFLLAHDIPSQQKEELARLLRDKLGTYARQDRVLASPEDIGVPRLLREPPSQWLTTPSGRIATLDRRIIGADWLAQPDPAPCRPPIVAFTSLKGGVGRTTALCVAAAELAREGSRVLVLDLDLEAPGAGALLLPTADRRPRFGVVDYLVERSLRNAPDDEPDDILDALVATCSFGQPNELTTSTGLALPTWSGLVDVVPAFGTSCQPEHYLGQLSRALMDSGPEGTQRPLRAKLADLLRSLSERDEYDIILVDVRAGLAEISAGPMLSIGANILLFGTGQRQTLEDLRLLFAHLSTLIPPESDSPWQKIEFVLAKAPSTNLEWFKDELYELFQSYIYEAQDGLEGFNFQRDDDEAPHHPVPIAFHPDFADWDPSRRPSDLSQKFYAQAFGPFLERVKALLGARE